MNEIKKRNCILCGRAFLYRTNKANVHSNITFRSKNALTDSKRCSRIFGIIRRNKKLMRKIRK